MVGLVSCMSVDQRCTPCYKMHGSLALVSVVYTIRWRHVRKKKATTQCHLFHHDHVLLHLGHPPRHLTTNIGPRPERIHRMRMRRGHLHVVHGPLGGVQQDYHMYTHSISIHKHRIMHEHILENTHTYPCKPPEFDGTSPGLPAAAACRVDARSDWWMQIG
jgi:hypothetical protein